MPIKFHTVAPKVTASEELHDVDNLDEPNPLFQAVDDAAPVVAAKKFSIDEIASIPQVAPGGGGGTGGAPVGVMPFVAEDYGLAGNPDSNVPATEPVAPQPRFIDMEFDAIVTEPQAAPAPAMETLEDPVSDAPIEDPSKSDDVSDPLEALIYFFLQVNSSPSDEQMHMLAAAVGIAKERLEECVYRILRDLMNESDYTPPVTASTDELADLEDDLSDELDLNEDPEEEDNNLEDASGEPGGQTDGEVSDDEFTHDPLIDPQTDDEIMQNDGVAVDDNDLDEAPLGFFDGAPV